MREYDNELVRGRHETSTMVISVSVLRRILSVEDLWVASVFREGVRVSTGSGFAIINACGGRGISGTGGISSLSSGSSLNLGSIGSSLPGI